MKVAILGTGNIGTDLLVKVLRSKYLECDIFSGQREDSPGIAFAKTSNVSTSTKSVSAVVSSDATIVFDCTSASAHKKHAKLLKDRFVIDMTPSHIGKMCVPDINLSESLKEKNVNLISCGAQATFPTINKIKDLEYVELVTTVASKSAGMGTRNNIDEYIETTTNALEDFFKVKAKAILLINPTIVTMHNTIYAKVKGKEEPKVVQQYVEGKGDFLPKYAGNLDCINVAAIRIAEEYAQNN